MSEAQLFPGEESVEGSTTPYRVLARKYRPWSFADLIGQEPMVRTLRNAFSQNRIAQAWLLTGVRGVGKTTTARILARALNYELDGEKGGPTVDMEREGLHCAAIMESRHVDVMEMDAASRTGIDDVREILDGVRYAPVSARTKVYIIDEVHMLSEKAFNAFLKTLEEPPPHVKFIFATTEARKVPVTVASRCQRFSLRRVDTGVLVRHLKKIAGLEAVTAEDDALAAIARAAEGSVRDALSLFDQAIAHGQGRVEAEATRALLGLSERGRIVDLFEALMRGQAHAAIEVFRALYDAGSEPMGVLGDLGDFIHFVTRAKLSPAALTDVALTEDERTRGAEFSRALSHSVLSRAWQILNRGMDEVRLAVRPDQAADMVLVRLAHAATLPAPEDALRRLALGETGSSAASGGAPSGGGGGGVGGGKVLAAAHGAILQRAAHHVSPDSAPLTMAINCLEDIVALADKERDLILKRALERDIHLVSLSDGKLEFRPASHAAADLANRLQHALSTWTGRRWAVIVSQQPGAPTLHDAAQAHESAHLATLKENPQVVAIMEKFPGSEIIGLRPMDSLAALDDETAEEG